MLGKADGLRLLDLSADGFWNSFFAIVVAAPALIVGWVGIANEIGDPDAFAGRFGMLMRLATVDHRLLGAAAGRARSGRAARRHRRPLRPLCRRQQLGVGHHRLADAAARR